jgi:hypothetical protein
MRIENDSNIERWTRPSQPGDQPEPGYAEWLAEEIEAGIAELDAGRGIPVEEVWKSLGLE